MKPRHRNPLLVLALAALAMWSRGVRADEAAGVEVIAKSMELRNAEYTATIERKMRQRMEAWHARVSRDIGKLYEDVTGKVDDGSLNDVSMLKAIRAKVVRRTVEQERREHPTWFAPAPQGTGWVTTPEHPRYYDMPN